MRGKQTFDTVTFTETNTGSVVIEERYSTMRDDCSRVELSKEELQRFLAWAGDRGDN